MPLCATVMDQLKDSNNMEISTACVSLMIHLHLRETNKQTPDHVQNRNSHMQDQDGGRKRRVENKGGEPDSVSTATLIDILQVEQLSSGLTTAS